jgi:hypothetical protein
VLEVGAPQACQVVDAVAVVDPHGVLFDDRPFIEGFGHVVGCCAEFDAALFGPPIRASTPNPVGLANARTAVGGEQDVAAGVSEAPVEGSGRGLIQEKMNDRNAIEDAPTYSRRGRFTRTSQRGVARRRHAPANTVCPGESNR